MAPGRGRKPSIPATTIRQIIDQTLQTTLPRATHWTCSSMAKTVVVSPDMVNRAWRENGLKPHLVRTFKLSSDRI